MKLLAIDPGPTMSAYVLLHNGQPAQFAKLPNPQIITTLQQSTATHHVIEMVQSFGMAVGKDIFETAFWSGRFYQIQPNSTYRLYRSDIKMHLCHSMRAKDPNIRQALIDRFGGSAAIGSKRHPGPLHGISGDCWAALAVAITFFDTQLDNHPPYA